MLVWNRGYNSDSPDLKKLLRRYNEQKGFNQMPQNAKTQ